MVVSKEGKRRRKVTTIAQTGVTNASGGAGSGGPTSSATADRDLSPPEIPKRPKVHAQRKFAQGQGAPSSSYLSYSTPPTPAKDAQSNRNSTGTGNNNGTTTNVASGGAGSESTAQVTELLPNMRPNTEDFLTYLCFRGTSVLPPALDFFNKSAGAGVPNTSGSSPPTASTSGNAGVSRQKTSETKVQSSTPTANNPKQQPSTVDKEEAVPESKNSAEANQEKSTPVVPPTYMPFAVRKRAEQHPAEARPDRKRTQDKMQALRKKYHDQRVAKLRATSQGKRGGTAAVSTRSSRAGANEPIESSENEGTDEEEKPVVGNNLGIKKADDNDGDDNDEHDDEMDAAENEQAGKHKHRKIPVTVNKRKSGLRSGSVAPQSLSPVESGKIVSAKNSRTKRESVKEIEKKEGQRKDPPIKVVNARTPNKSKTSPSPDQSPQETPRTVSGRASSRSKCKTSPTETQQNSPSRVSSRDEAEGREKRTTRLSSLRAPLAQGIGKVPEGNASPSTTTKVKEKKQETTPVQESVGYSSDDDEPLSRSARTERRSAVKDSLANVTVAAKTTRSGRSRRSEPISGEKELDETPDKKLRRSESVVSRRSDISSKKSTELRETASVTVDKKTSERPQQPQRGTKRKETPVLSESFNEKELSSPGSSPIAGGRRQTAAAANVNKKKKETTGPESSKTPDISTNALAGSEEKKSKTASSTPTPAESLATGRPSRKTKEAATLYMELIGRKLNHDDKSDDDASSLDSLELPNVRKLEKMENELKANAGKKDPKQQQQATGGGKSVPATAKGMKSAASKQAETKKKKATAEDPMSSVDENCKKVAERSFSDSDEEPLASKFQRKKQPNRQQSARARQHGAGAGTAKANATKKAVATGRGKGGEDSSRSEQDLTPEKQNIGQAEAEHTEKPNLSATIVRGTPRRSLTSPVGKQNGTTTPSAAVVANSNANVGLKTPTKAVSKGAHCTLQESPASKEPPDRSQSSARLNKSLDNTHHSTTVEASESPIKIPQVLNIPTLLTSPVQAAAQAPFTRTARLAIGSNSTANNCGLDNAASSPFLEKPNVLPAAGTVDNIPFNRPPAPVAPTKGAPFTSLDEADFLKGFDPTHSPTDPTAQVKSSVNSLLGNLLPSKEESEKIFGIASVSLAQSSGPLDTKCTLGKCGSVHKPPLGPPVLTESLLGGNLSPRDRRKAKVNMTHEQIQKWIDESSWSPIEDDLKDDDVEVLEPGVRGATGASTTVSTRTPPPSQQPSLPPSSSGPATAQSTSVAWERLNVSEQPGGMQNDAANGSAIILAETATSVALHTGTTGNGRTKEDNERSVGMKTQPSGGTQPRSGGIGKVTDQEISPAGTSAVDKMMTNERNKISTTPTGRQKKEPATPTTTGKREVKEPRGKSKVETSGGGSSMTTNAPQSRSPATTPTTPGDRKPIYRTAAGRTPVYKQEPKVASNQAQTTYGTTSTSRPAPTTVTQGQQQHQQQLLQQHHQYQQHHQHQQYQHQQVSSNKFGAFSPVNEPSVYSFDKEEDFMPVATPFRRQHTGTTGRRESCNSSARDEPTTANNTGGVKREPTPVVPDDKLPKPCAGVGGGSSGPTKGATTVLNAAGQSHSAAAPIDFSGTANDNVKSVGMVTGAHGRGDSGEKKRSPGEDTTKGGRADVKPEAATSTSDPEADGGGQTFYIPLQGPSSGVGASGTGGAKSVDQLIQGVAVKLGTEGPDGPNQRVIMHAKLVTKAEMGSNPTTLPDSMNVQELVKSLTQAGGSTACALGKEGLSKLVPIGTVQPRFKSADGTAGGTPAPAEDRNSAEPPMSRGGLSRINSNSSLSSQRSKPAKATAAGNPKTKGELVISPQPDNNTVFPRRDDPAQMVEAPVFKPTEKEFQDPMEYIERIAPVASRFGICRIIPPASFKPECRIADDMRFMAYNQYVHKMLHRWGPSAKEYAAIKKYLATQSINLQTPPVIGGMEVDLPRLYHTVQELGGLKEVIEKKRWARVSEDMCIPKAAHDRVSKLDDIYCKYLLPYDTLSPAERQKLFDEVEADWAKREAKARRNADKGVGSEIRNSGDSDEDDDEDEDEEEDDEEDFSMECIVKGRNMPLNQFFRIARNTMSLWFKNSEPTVAEIEAEYWRHVAVRDSHVCVHSGSIDSSAFGFGFPSPKVKGSSCAKHPWNLKVLTNNSGSILRSLGPVMGITIPTLHVGMLFSACCWYRDPHGLPWIEYLHTGANKIWYGVPDDQNANFRAALTVLVPTHCQNKTIWLPCDTAMVPPHMLTDRHVSLCRTEQQPGQFVVVFPRAYTSSLCTGYAVSESVYFATNSWLDTAKDDFRDIQESCEPTMFSVEQLLFAIANDQRSNHDTLAQAYPMIVGIYEKEKQHRQTLKEQGVTKSEKIESKKKTVSLEEFECERCRANLYLSLVKVKSTPSGDGTTGGDNDGSSSVDDEEEEEERIYCLKHAVKHLTDGGLQTKHCRLAYTYSLDDIEDLLKKLQDRIANKKSSKSSVAGSSGGGGGGGGGAGGGCGGGTGVGTGAAGGKGKSSLHLASTSSQSSSSYQAPSHSKFAGMATMLK